MCIIFILQKCSGMSLTIWIIMASVESLKDCISRLPAALQNQPVTNLHEIAKSFPKWKSVLPFLGLDETHKENIIEDHDETATRRFAEPITMHVYTHTHTHTHLLTCILLCKLQQTFVCHYHIGWQHCVLGKLNMERMLHTKLFFKVFTKQTEWTWLRWWLT